MPFDSDLQTPTETLALILLLNGVQNRCGADSEESAAWDTGLQRDTALQREIALEQDTVLERSATRSFPESTTHT